MKQIKWRLIDSGYNSAYMNMAIDEVLMSSCQNEESMPVLRFYQWNPPGLSIGYSQKVKGFLNLRALEKSGINVVRRITGGEAVLHDKDLTYCVVIREEFLEHPETQNFYKLISDGIKEGLKYLGVVVDKAEGPKKGDKAFNCFLNISNYEISIEGRKLVGSAQRRSRRALLQHGSILLDVDYKKVAKVFSHGDRSYPEEDLVKDVKKKMISLREYVRGIPDAEMVKKVIIEGFETLYGIKFDNCPLKDDEKARAKELSREKYNSDRWTLLN